MSTSRREALTQRLTDRERRLTIAEDAVNWITFVARRNGRQFAEYARLSRSQLEREIALAVVDAAREMVTHWPADRPAPDEQPDVDLRSLSIFDRAISRLLRQRRAAERRAKAEQQGDNILEFRRVVFGARDDEEDDDE